jgi:hypothetical protein
LIAINLYDWSRIRTSIKVVLRRFQEGNTYHISYRKREMTSSTTEFRYYTKNIVWHTWNRSCLPFRDTYVHSWFLVGFVAAQCLVFCIVFCGSLVELLSFTRLVILCLSFFDLRFLNNSFMLFLYVNSIEASIDLFLAK